MNPECLRSGIKDLFQTASLKFKNIRILLNLPGVTGTQPPLTFKGRKDDLNQQRRGKSHLSPPPWLRRVRIRRCDVTTASLVRARVST